MAKSTGPLFSLNAHGSIKKTLMYQKRKEGQKTRKYTKPKEGGSSKQRARRRLMEFLVAHWQGMSGADKLIWQENAEAKRLGITGYQFFLKESQRDLATYHGLRDYFDLNIIEELKLYSLTDTNSELALLKFGGSNYPVHTNSYSKKFDKGLLFDGAGAYTRNANSSWKDLGQNDIFIEMWIKLDQYIADSALLNYLVVSPIRGIRIYANTQGIRVLIGDSIGTKDFQGLIGVHDEKWHCIQIVIDRSSTLRLLIDGEENPAGIDITSLTGSLTPIGDFTISTSGLPVKGIIDEIALYWRTPTNEELARRYFFGKKNQKT